MGKSSVNWPFSIAMLNNQRVAPEAFFLQVTDGEKGHCFNKCAFQFQEVLCGVPF